MKIDATEKLASYVDALYPIIYINHFDFAAVDKVLGAIAKKRKVLEFSEGVGAVDFATKAPLTTILQGGGANLYDFLQSIKDEPYDTPVFIVLKDIHAQLEDAKIISLLKYIANRNLDVQHYEATIFILSNKLKVCAELEDYITVFDFPLPSLEEIRDLIAEFAADSKIKVKPEDVGELAISFKGLNEFQIKQILNLAYQDGGDIKSEDKQLILEQKEQLIKKAGTLEVVAVKESIEDIGGLNLLKAWLEKKQKVFSHLDRATRFGVDTPKGIMIVGMPGCGKSLAAKATATLFKIPLVRLDIGRLLGKYIGESEENMHRALKLAEAISPCVLWVDEIEKAFAGVGGIGGGSDVTTRLFGQFLTWMQEKENTVFVVATANDISNIPPELFRKGRFDELFSVDFPDENERRKILEIHLAKRKQKTRDLNLGLLVRETDGYSGADLEAIVKDAIEECFARNVPLNAAALQRAKKNTKSIKASLKNRIEDIKKRLDEMDLKPASGEVAEKDIAAVGGIRRIRVREK